MRGKFGARRPGPTKEVVFHEGGLSNEVLYSIRTWYPIAMSIQHMQCSGVCGIIWVYRMLPQENLNFYIVFMLYKVVSRAILDHLKTGFDTYSWNFWAVSWRVSSGRRIEPVQSCEDRSKYNSSFGFFN